MEKNRVIKYMLIKSINMRIKMDEDNILSGEEMAMFIIIFEFIKNLK